MDKYTAKYRFHRGLNSTATREFYELVLGYFGDERVESLSDGDFRFWVKLRASFSVDRYDLPEDARFIAYLLEIPEEECATRLGRLVVAGLATVVLESVPPSKDLSRADQNPESPVSHEKLSNITPATEVVQ